MLYSLNVIIFALVIEMVIMLQVMKLNLSWRHYMQDCISRLLQ